MALVGFSVLIHLLEGVGNSVCVCEWFLLVKSSVILLLLCHNERSSAKKPSSNTSLPYTLFHDKLLQVFFTCWHKRAKVVSSRCDHIDFFTCTSRNWSGDGAVMKRRLTSFRAWARKDIAYNISLPWIVAEKVKCFGHTWFCSKILPYTPKMGRIFAK